MPNVKQLFLENQLCFPLYVCSKEVIRQYKPYLDEIGLTYTQYIVMLVLWQKKSLSTKELGAYLYLDSGTLTPLLKKLELSGLISRRRDEADARNVIISLTEKGLSLRRRAETIPVRMGQCLHLTDKEAQMLYELLYKLLGNLEIHHEKEKNDERL